MTAKTQRMIHFIRVVAMFRDEVTRAEAEEQSSKLCIHGTKVSHNHKRYQKHQPTVSSRTPPPRTSALSAWKYPSKSWRRRPKRNVPSYSVNPVLPRSNDYIPANKSSSSRSALPNLLIMRWRRFQGDDSSHPHCIFAGYHRRTERM